MPLEKPGRAGDCAHSSTGGDHHALWALGEVLRDQGREAEALLTRGLTAGGRGLPDGPAD